MEDTNKTRIPNLTSGQTRTAISPCMSMFAMF